MGANVSRFPFVYRFRMFMVRLRASGSFTFVRLRFCFVFPRMLCWLFSLLPPSEVKAHLARGALRWARVGWGSRNGFYSPIFWDLTRCGVEGRQGVASR